MSENGATKAIAAECPMSWCEFVAVAKGSDAETEAADKVETHVNQDHSEKDIDTLSLSVDLDTDDRKGDAR